MTTIYQRYVLFLFLAILCSCSPEKGPKEMNLLPMPQQVTVTGAGKHPILSGSIDESVITERIIDEIPEASINAEEAYRLTVTRDSILIEAVTQKGMYWAKQTLRQLITQDKKGEFYLPVCRIVDYPAFRIRGFMHDVGRSFIPAEELKKQIALLSQYKINVFHWHLTENQGWRLESKKYPQLTDSANFERLPGQYYTIEEAREIAHWCLQHNMLLIPEIDMPGHSAAFVRAMGVDMQSKKGMEILKNLMSEICTEVFPDIPYIHIGTDEVQFTHPGFVPEMVSHIRSLGKRVISWNPGWNYKPGEIDMTQLWSYRGKAQPGIPAIDSRFHYINHFDAFGDIVALYNSRIADAEQGSDDIAGGIIAVWNDRLLPDETDILLQNNFYPSMLAFAERTWLGGGSEYFDRNGVILPADENDEVFKSFADFERRMLRHKENVFQNEPFPYVKQTNVKWHITDAFPNEGDLSASFPPEKSFENSYLYNGRTYNVRPAVGAGIYLRHVWGTLVPAFFDDPRENHTAYAYTWVYSPEAQDVGLWLEFQNYSRSEPDLPPPAGRWDYRGSRAWLNDTEIPPPVWTATHAERSNEIVLGNENLTARPPIGVHLDKGWNKVLLKLPVGKFSQPEVRLVKWMFSCVFVTPDGQKAVDGLIYSPEKIK
ncbi:family 20 glycosylhydrolase [Proteiniphilum sp. X52]|uniref:family 20 glycosylhydrolase n=1 Tax=Proteiniphilum sp. X52 TaxID=2382159 RepID=UPI000F0A7A76|nr:beta-N-acetylhexosaminidase [Proteiniphilum sp. X52]